MVDALVPAILEQKVTGNEAFVSYRRLVMRYGVSAPGAEAAQRGLLVMYRIRGAVIGRTLQQVRQKLSRIGARIKFHRQHFADRRAGPAAFGKRSAPAQHE